MSLIVTQIGFNFPHLSDLFYEVASLKRVKNGQHTDHPESKRFETSQRIRKAWDEWRWPISMIAGNHEPLHRLRAWEPEYFSEKLNYTDAGELPNSIAGLSVYGLSGIFHPGELQFMNESEKWRAKKFDCSSWPEMVELVRKNSVSPKRLTYYKQDELDRLLMLPPNPPLLLTHD